MASPDRVILYIAASLGIVSGGNPVQPTYPDGQPSHPPTVSVEDVQKPDAAVIEQSFFESNFMSGSSLEDLIAESEMQGKAIFPFAIKDPDDVDVSLDGDDLLVTVRNPVSYISNTDGMLYAGIYGQKVTVKKHIDLSIESGMFTVAEVDEDKGIRISTSFRFHNSDFIPGWKKGKSREQFAKGQRVFTFLGSEAIEDLPEDTLILRVSGPQNPLDYFAQKNGKILYWNGKRPEKA